LAAPPASAARPACTPTTWSPKPPSTGVNALRSLRVYHTHADHREPVRDAVARHVRQVDKDVPVEWIHAPLCRTDLDVEIEGVAALD